MSRSHLSRLAAGLVLAALMLAPALAEAAAGSGSSAGSRGSRTYSAPAPTQTAPSSQPVQRSMTQPTQPQRPAATPQTAPGQAQPSFFQRNPFVGGLIGGLVGAGIAGMLFGHGFFGGDFGMAGMLGLFLQLALVGVAVYFLFSWLRSRNGAQGFGFGQAPVPAGGPAGALGSQANRYDAHAGSGGGQPVRDEIGIGQDDLGAFEHQLKGIQAAWSKQDLGALRRLVTPEMLHYFSEELAQMASRGVVNRVENVQLLQGDLSEAWRESDVEYATVAMRWSANDTMVDAASGKVVEGDPQHPKETTEVWTFMRGRGGNWLLSAIQQV
ncbi:MAG: TIM44-like domain-containing protein [Proteobacteria bacterium]|nr:TIM44-like domain-containing protein [Pseudomonadota bacterium]MBI3498401.1 TIM44-like domain-containing protein [Pseudomonadota bacterium]